MSSEHTVTSLISRIKACNLCEKHLPFGARPVFQFSKQAKILIAGQAPGRIVHESGVPFADASGNRLREWLGLTEEQFYDPQQVAILPMGFCYPGTGKSGDLPPRPECSETWHAALLSQLKQRQLTIILGTYAVQYYLPNVSGTLTEIVRNWQRYEGNVFPLPHPSPRNNIWLKRNSWFEKDVIPEIKQRVKGALREG